MTWLSALGSTDHSCQDMPVATMSEWESCGIMDVGVITALMTLFLSYNCDRLIMPFYSLLALPLGAELPEPRSKQVQRFHTIGCWVFSILMPTRLLGWPLDMF